MIANLLLAGMLFFFHFQDITPGFLKENPIYGRSALIVDIDRDGDQDVFLYSPLPGESRLLENIGNQSFFDVTELWRLDLSVGFKKVLSGDINNDGLPDLLLMVNLPNSPLKILMNTGHYFCELHDRVVESITPTDICLADWNNDGYPDIVSVTNDGAPKISLLENQNGEHFTKSEFSFPPLPDDSIISFSVMDLDGDGLIDLFFVMENSIFAILNGGALKSYTLSKNLRGAHIISDTKTGGDILAFINLPTLRNTFVLRKAKLSLEPVRLDESAEFPSSGVISDIDLDGRPEIVGVDQSGLPLILEFGEDGALHQVPNDAPSKSFYSISLGDLNGDKAQDIVLIGNNGVYFLLNRSPRGHFVEIKMGGHPSQEMATTIFYQGKKFNFSLSKSENLIGLGELGWIDSLVVTSGDKYLLTFYNIPTDTSIVLPSLGIEVAGIPMTSVDTSVVRVTPNPSSHIFTFSLSLDKRSQLDLQVLSTSGAVIEEVASNIFEPGEYSFTWDASGYVPGIYLLRVGINQKSFLKKLILLR